LDDRSRRLPPAVSCTAGPGENGNGVGSATGEATGVL
jgi:hypothetical protein